MAKVETMFTLRRAYGYFEETGNRMMHSNNYLEKENRDTKPFLEEIINDLNEYKNIENDCLLT